LGPVVDDVGLDSEPGGGLGDGELTGLAVVVVGVAVDVAAGGQAFVAGGLDVGSEGDGPVTAAGSAGG
jgi:hypothetical protein